MAPTCTPVLLPLVLLLLTSLTGVGAYEVDMSSDAPSIVCSSGSEPNIDCSSCNDQGDCTNDGYCWVSPTYLAQSSVAFDSSSCLNYDQMCALGSCPASSGGPEEGAPAMAVVVAGFTGIFGFVGLTGILCTTMGTRLENKRRARYRKNGTICQGVVTNTAVRVSQGEHSTNVTYTASVHYTNSVTGQHAIKEFTVDSMLPQGHQIMLYTITSETNNPLNVMLKQEADQDVNACQVVAVVIFMSIFWLVGIGAGIGASVSIGDGTAFVGVGIVISCFCTVICPVLCATQGVNKRYASMLEKPKGNLTTQPPPVMMTTPVMNGQGQVVQMPAGMMQQQQMMMQQQPQVAVAVAAQPGIQMAPVAAAAMPMQQQQQMQAIPVANKAAVAVAVAPAQAVAAPAQAVTMADQLQNLTTLHQQGALTDEQFEAAKNKVVMGSVA